MEQAINLNGHWFSPVDDTYMAVNALDSDFLASQQDFRALRQISQQRPISGQRAGTH
jgi:hypothetical protein